MGISELPKLYFTVEELAERWKEYNLIADDILHYIETGVLQTSVFVSNLHVFMGIESKKSVFTINSDHGCIDSKIFYDVATISGAFGISVSDSRILLNDGEISPVIAVG